MMIKKLLLSFILLISLLVGSMPDSHAVTYTASADFALKLTPAPKNQVGFLHGIGATQPQTSVFSVLKPAYWRMAVSDTTTFNRAVAAGATPIIVISDGYGYPLNNWNGRGAVYSGGYAAWEAYIHSITAQYKGKRVIFDIWNEPDIAVWNTAQFWDGTAAQFYETFRRGALAIRQDLGSSAQIIGPSFANYDAPAMAAFLTYAAANGVRMDGLAWHELSGVDTNLSLIASHIATQKALIASTYPNIGIKKYFIPESVGPAITYHPGDILGVLYYLEQGLSDGSCRACWNDSTGSNNCFNNSQDGVVQKTTGSATRAAWWPYYYYAQIFRSRVTTTSSNSNLIVMAGKRPSKILVGYAGTTPAAVDVTLTIKNPAALGYRGGTIKASIYKIPATGEATVEAPTLVSTQQVTITAGVGTVNLSNILLHELYEVRLSP